LLHKILKEKKIYTDNKTQEMSLAKLFQYYTKPLEPISQVKKIRSPNESLTRQN
jgi:hypothetical protein